MAKLVSVMMASQIPGPAYPLKYSYVPTKASPHMATANPKDIAERALETCEFRLK